MGKIVGVIGGMGPMATLDFAQKILSFSDATKDQEFPHIIIDNNTEIPDRSSYILSGAEDPFQKLEETAYRLVDAGASILGMPCNTAHYFYDRIVESLKLKYPDKDILFLNMIEEVAKQVIFENKKKIFLLSTLGTIKVAIYQKKMNSFGIEVILPSIEIQKKIMDMIYALKSGETDFDRDYLSNVLNESKMLYSAPIVLGCTELPIIFNSVDLLSQTMDPTAILAKSVNRHLNDKDLESKKKE